MTVDPRLAHRDAVAAETVSDLVRLIPAGAPFLLIDEQFLDIAPLVTDRTCLRFKPGKEPAAESALLREFEDFRTNGMRFVVVAWPALWWLQHYRSLVDRIHGLSASTHVGDGYVVYKLGDREGDWFVRVRGIVRTHVPDDAGLLVVSRGDDTLLWLGGRKTWHFLSAPDGSYAGAPEDSEDAVRHLERMKADGAEYLLIPEWARWWLDYYDGLRGYLDQNCRLVSKDDDCRLYRLTLNS